MFKMCLLKVIYCLSTPNIIANIRHALLYECADRAMRKKLKLSSDGGESGSKKYRRGCGGTYGGVWGSLRLAGLWSLESGGRFCIGTFYRNLASFAVKLFPHLIYLIKKFYRCTLNAICKDNAAVNCITFQHKKDSSPSTLTDLTTLVTINNPSNAELHFGIFLKLPFILFIINVSRQTICIKNLRRGIPWSVSDTLFYW
jgi:hypothetical protein